MNIASLIRSIWVWLFVFLSACSTQQIDVQRAIVPATDAKLFLLRESLTFRVPNAASQTLKENTTWTLVGELEEGLVLKTDDQVVLLNSFNVYEANIVVNDELLVGLYLPISETFVAIKPTPIFLAEQLDEER